MSILRSRIRYYLHLAILESEFNFFSCYVQVKTYDKARNALALALSPVVRALVDPDGAMRDIRNLDGVRMITFISGLWISSFVFLLRKIYSFLFISLPHYTLYWDSGPI